MLDEQTVAILVISVLVLIVLSQLLIIYHLHRCLHDLRMAFTAMTKEIGGLQQARVRLETEMERCQEDVRNAADRAEQANRIIGDLRR